MNNNIGIITIIRKGLPYARFCSKCFTYNNSQQFYKVGIVMIIIPIFQVRKLSTSISEALPLIERRMPAYICLKIIDVDFF